MSISVSNSVQAGNAAEQRQAGITAELRQAGITAELRQAGQAFETLMLRQLLQPVLPGAEGAAPLALDALASRIAADAPFGFARLIGADR